MKVMRVNHGKVFGSNHRYTFYFPNMAGVVEDRGGRRNNVCSYFFINDRITHSPTTSPCGYSSFPKEEI